MDLYRKQTTVAKNVETAAAYNEKAYSRPDQMLRCESALPSMLIRSHARYSYETFDIRICMCLWTRTIDFHLSNLPCSRIIIFTVCRGIIRGEHE